MAEQKRNTIFVPTLFTKFIIPMKNLRLLLLLLLALAGTARAADTLYVRETQVPILIERQDNVLFYLRLNAKDSQTLNEVTRPLPFTLPRAFLVTPRNHVTSFIAKASSAMGLASKPNSMSESKPEPCMG